MRHAAALEEHSRRNEGRQCGVATRDSARILGKRRDLILMGFGRMFPSNGLAT
jgi:hypothetical protein